jgi:hypothetical protein
VIWARVLIARETDGKVIKVSGECWEEKSWNFGFHR